MGGAMAAETFQIRVAKPDGATIEIQDALKSWNGLNVKKQVTRAEGIPWKEQKLLMGEREIADGDLLSDVLADANLEQGIDITMVRCLKTGLAGWGSMVEAKLETTAPTDGADLVERLVEKKKNEQE